MHGHWDQQQGRAAWSAFDDTPMRVVRFSDGGVSEEQAELIRKWLYGDGTCDIRNVKDSCFASEVCSRGRDPSLSRSLHHMLRTNNLYVAVSDDDEGLWMGCALAEKDMRVQSSMPLLFPCHFNEGSTRCNRARSTVVYSLCVPSCGRGQRVGTSILKRICSDFDQVYLLVDTHRTGQCNVLRDFMETRSDNLLGYYKQQGFKRCGERDGYVLHMRTSQSSGVRPSSH